MTTIFSDLPRLSIIVPTFRESENLPTLIPQIADTLNARGWTWEVIIIDDNSPDSTPQILQTLQHDYPQLRYQIRTQDRGLSSAVLTGISLARYDYFIVMDADLSHPPQAIPQLIEKLQTQRTDFVLGSRYVPGGKTEDWTLFRWLNSAVATCLSRPLAGKIHDPMSGFFAFHRSLLQSADSLNPIGYKIGLELLVKCQAQSVSEVPILFKNRLHGQSKLTLREQFRYLEHLSRLYDYKFPKGTPRAKFLFASGCGALACLGTIAGLEHFAGITLFPITMALGILAMIAVTLAFFVRYVIAQRDFLVMKHPYSEFVYISLVELLVGWFFAVSTGDVGTSSYLKATIGIAAIVVVRYSLRKFFQHDIRGIRGHLNPTATKRLQLTPAATRSAASA